MIDLTRRSFLRATAAALACPLPVLARAAAPPAPWSTLPARGVHRQQHAHVRPDDTIIPVVLIDITRVVPKRALHFGRFYESLHTVDRAGVLGYEPCRLKLVGISTYDNGVNATVVYHLYDRPDCWGPQEGEAGDFKELPWGREPEDDP